jgi:hypothetical protein
MFMRHNEQSRVGSSGSPNSDLASYDLEDDQELGEAETRESPKLWEQRLRLQGRESLAHVQKYVGERGMG